ncbi:uncharacterized protein LOC110702318 [Chenopodium quinoa]|uniref:uncharacterized protein LOC110702318 n=1 Tax=Chenopodium quinoa TaxID=63459 RepID=UPI000B77A81A|nr:uncharacterized protein LOC110702318 [Chenopodium quinoa]
MILVYVDDLIVAGNDMKEINEAKMFLASQFNMKDMGELRYFLGIEVDRSEQGMFLSQRKYITDILEEYDMMNVRPLKLPMDAHLKLRVDSGNVMADPEPYQRLIGRLIYLTITRPDISFTVHVLSKFMHKPTDVHYQCAVRVLRYLSGTIQQGILLASQGSAELKAYCDSDWAGCQSTRRSTSGFCILLGRSPVSWKSKRQSTVAKSTAETEYRSMALTVCEVMWLKELLKDLGMSKLGTTSIFCDNQAALAIAANPVHHEKTKHVDIDCHFIREKFSDGIIAPTYVHNSQQLADMFTKILSVEQMNQLMTKLGVQPQSSLSA